MSFEDAVRAARMERTKQEVERSRAASELAAREGDARSAADRARQEVMRLVAASHRLLQARVPPVPVIRVDFRKQGWATCRGEARLLDNVWPLGIGFLSSTSGILASGNGLGEGSAPAGPNAVLKLKNPKNGAYLSCKVDWPHQRLGTTPEGRYLRLIIDSLEPQSLLNMAFERPGRNVPSITADFDGNAMLAYSEGHPDVSISYHWRPLEQYLAERVEELLSKHES